MSEKRPEPAADEPAAAPAKRQKSNDTPSEEAVSETVADRPKIAESCGRAQFWYYKDTYGQLQGPFYPGDMHDWFAAKHFLPSQMVAPSFQGEVPQEFYQIEELFDLDAAFHCNSDVAWKPPQELPPPEPEYSDAELQKMLKDRFLNTNNKNGPGNRHTSPYSILTYWFHCSFSVRWQMGR